jgi:DNA-binding response OmpR family regulator
MVLSGMIQAGNVQTALNLGACDFLEKPFSLQELSKRVAALVTR